LAQSINPDVQCKRLPLCIALLLSTCKAAIVENLVMAIILVSTIVESLTRSESWIGLEELSIGRWELKQFHVVSSQMTASNWTIHRGHSLPQLEAYSWDSRTALPKHFSTFSRFCVLAPDVDFGRSA
jgi:hypothetical protein